jgi:hypothetical protein
LLLFNNPLPKTKRDLPGLSKKEEEAKKKEELAQIFKPVTQQQKVAAGVDPKSILCQFFKQGLCTKGAKCKFSHDVAIQRKAEKIDLYTDQREAEEKGNATTHNTTQHNTHTFQHFLFLSLSQGRDGGLGSTEVGGSGWKETERDGRTNGDCVQVLLGSDRDEEVRLVLGVSQRRRPVSLQARSASWFCPQDQGKENRRRRCAKDLNRRGN